MDEEKKQSPADAAESSAKQVYSTPELKRFGKLADLTQAFAEPGSDNGPQGTGSTI
jgi:hypothetical protein